jgi:hypothetical protein
MFDWTRRARERIRKELTALALTRMKGEVVASLERKYSA